MSSHYPDIVTAFSKYYKTGVQAVEKLLLDCYPDQPKKDLKKAMYILAILLEGTCIVFGGNYRLNMKIDQVIPEISNMFERYLNRTDR